MVLGGERGGRKGEGVCGCGVVWCGVVWCGVVWCGVVWCGVVWCGGVWCGVVWCGVVWCGVVWCGVVWCGVVWCGEVRGEGGKERGIGEARKKGVCFHYFVDLVFFKKKTFCRKSKDVSTTVCHVMKMTIISANMIEDNRPVRPRKSVRIQRSDCVLYN